MADTAFFHLTKIESPWDYCSRYFLFSRLLVELDLKKAGTLVEIYKVVAVSVPVPVLPRLHKHISWLQNKHHPWGFMSKLERLTYICLIGMCLVSGTILIREHWSIRESQTNIQENPAAGLVGKKLQIPGVDWKSSQLSTVLFLSTSCHFCEASMPFYRRLVAQHQQGQGKNIALLAISAEPDHIVNSYLMRERVNFDHVYQISLPDNLLRGTPTLLVVDDQGMIRRADIGQLNPSKEDELLNIFKRAN